MVPDHHSSRDSVPLHSKARIEVLTPRSTDMNLAIINAQTQPGFITEDNLVPLRSCPVLSFTTPLQREAMVGVKVMGVVRPNVLQPSTWKCFGQTKEPV
ncbi:hypothetical protein GDO78_015685 [Eleutherodactylus coqui]|uniref:Uncharacterized protein n=1 Tax=Eleutherodactylus coqui TaxID=57060 RepID=A0A8J6JJK4_ELECQ|nr:hypothetical protein GDO78_015685 [Eleutherodactylus coqui]